MNDERRPINLKYKMIVDIVLGSVFVLASLIVGLKFLFSKELTEPVAWIIASVWVCSIICSTFTLNNNEWR